MGAICRTPISCFETICKNSYYCNTHI
jgi:hypothetical protein